MASLEINGRVKSAKEKITHVSDSGGTDSVCEITFEVQGMHRRDFLRLVRARLLKDDVLLTLDLSNFQMSLDDMWDKGPATEGP